MTTTARLVVLSGCLLASAAYVAATARSESVPPREPLSTFPTAMASWTDSTERPLDQATLDVLKVDEYVSRTYRSTAQGQIGLYVGYYRSQRQGETIHSPLNCLPGAGWYPVSKSYLSIPVQDVNSVPQTIPVNRYVIQKGLEQQVVLYWYQGHGRVVANEYASKFYLVYDALRINRTDAALVRVVSPRIGSGPEADAAAESRAVEFVKAMFPILGRYLPS